MQADGHISPYELERYQLHLLEEVERSPIEQHLRWCLDCNDRSMAIERFIALVKEGRRGLPWQRYFW